MLIPIHSIKHSGFFIPLIVTNCIVIGRAEAFASKNSVAHAAWDGFSMGLGMALSITVLGALREILGQGTLFEGIEICLVRGQNSSRYIFTKRIAAFYSLFFRQVPLLD